MVRPIKFRAWHKYGGGMMVVDSLYFINDLVGVVDKSHETRVMGYSFANVEIMQYTGLKDEDGKEIYEGDVIIHHFMVYQGPGSVGEEKEIIAVEDITKLPFDSSSLGCKIVGNIYENPDLLKGAEPNDDQS